MAPPKKGQKMSLGDFLGDQSLGTTSSWADEMEDMPAVRGSSTGYARREYGDSSGGGGGGGFGSFSRNDREERYPREQLPIPDKPPFTAHVGNLSFDVSENEISEFFEKCDVSNVRLVRDKMEDRPKGFGYVEFNTKEGLIAAIELNGSQLSGRNVRINVADPPKDRGEERTLGEWRRTGPLPALENTGRRGSERGGFGDRGDRGGFGDRDRDRMSSESGDRGERRQSAFEGSDKLRNLDKWERTGPLPPSTPTAGEHRPRSGERNERGEPREFRRRSPAPSAEGTPKREYRERPAIERQPTAPERDNEWRRGARPDPPAPQRTPTAPSSPVAATTRPRLELKKRSEHPIEPALASATSDSSSKPNPFGAARPIDTFQRDKEVEEKRLAAIAAKRAKDEKDRKTRAAAGENDKSEAGTPTTTKDFSLLRRASGATEANTAEAEGEGEAATTITAPSKKREERPTKATPSNWRKQEPKETPVEEAADGWSTVPPKKGRAAGARV
ncbi:hypothetical protein DFP73DRAFT_529321 [Morchella snyderi]|nr:hypothetical protein DFP73DRAFT_529321 [Morchella snyderi]